MARQAPNPASPAVTNELAKPQLSGTFQHRAALAETAPKRLITRRSQVQILPPPPIHQKSRSEAPFRRGLIASRRKTSSCLGVDTRCRELDKRPSEIGPPRGAGNPAGLPVTGPSMRDQSVEQRGADGVRRLVAEIRLRSFGFVLVNWSREPRWERPKRRAQAEGRGGPHIGRDHGGSGLRSGHETRRCRGSRRWELRGLA